MLHRRKQIARMIVAARELAVVDVEKARRLHELKITEVRPRFGRKKDVVVKGFWDADIDFQTSEKGQVEPYTVSFRFQADFRLLVNLTLGPGKSVMAAKALNNPFNGAGRRTLFDGQTATQLYESSKEVKYHIAAIVFTHLGVLLGQYIEDGFRGRSLSELITNPEPG